MIGMFAVPLSAYGAGLVRHDTYLQQTALLTAEAVVDSEVLTQAMKATTRRLLPGTSLRTATSRTPGSATIPAPGMWRRAASPPAI